MLGRAARRRSSSDDLAAALAAAGTLHPELEHLMPALAGITMAPTMVGGSDKRNVMPSKAWVELDCRILPGTTAADVEAAVRDRLTGTGARPGLRPVMARTSDRGQRLAAGWAGGRAIRDWLTSEGLEADLLPSLGTGFTDSIYLRAAAGTAAYGFSPYLTTPLDVLVAGATTPTSGCTSTTCSRPCGSTCTWRKALLS